MMDESTHCESRYGKYIEYYGNFYEAPIYSNTVLFIASEYKKDGFGRSRPHGRNLPQPA
jgi:hypothetical protein